MKLTMYYKDSVRKLKKSIFRYISIVIIIMLGVGFFVGMNSVAPDMKLTTEDYLKRTNIFDIQLLSNLGYEEEDVEKFKELDNVTDAEPIYSYDVLTHSEKKDIPVRVISTPKNPQINKNDLIEGREPEKNNECLIDTRLQNMYSYKVGDKIEIFKKSEDLSKKISESEYTIVGITRNPVFLSIFYGSTELENGELEAFIVVPQEVIKLEQYSAIYLKTNIDENIERTSEEYKKKLDEISGKIEEINEKIVNDKFDEKYNENNDKIRKNENQIKKAQKVVKDAKDEISSAQKQINSAILQVVANTSSNDYEKFSNKKEQLDEKYSTIDELNVEKEKIEEQYELLKSDIETKQQELFNLNTAINNQIYESHLLENENSKYVELTRETNKLDYEYNIKTSEFDKINEDYKKIEEELKNKTEKIKQNEEEAKKEQDDFYNQFLKVSNNSAIGNSILEEAISQIKENQEELNDNVKELEEANIEERLEKAKNKVTDAKKELSKFEPVAQTIKLYESGAFKSLNNDLEKIGIMGKVFPVMFFVVAALVTMTTITRMVEEDRTNIGTLKSLGYKKSTIMIRYVIYALSATVLGLIFGTLIGSTLIAQVLFAAYSSLYVLPDLIIEINMFYTILASVISILATVGVTIVITKKELKEKPAMLMRPKQVKEGKNIFLEKIPTLWERLSFLFKICFRNIFRYKRRLFMTLIGIAGCTMLVYTGIAIKGTVDNIAIRQFSEIRTYDMEVNLATTATEKEIPDLKEDILDVDKVIETTPARQQMTTIEANDVNKEIFYTVVDKDEVAKYIQLKDRNTQNQIKLTDDGIILTEKLANVLQVKAGDNVKIIEDDKEKTVQVTGVTENYLYNYMYLTPKLYTQIYEKEIQYNIFIANLEEISEEDETDISNNLKENDKISGAVYIRNLNKDFKSSLSGLESIVFLFIGCASLLAFIVLINLNNINIEERRRELATFKLLGFFKKELEHYIFRENIILTIIGAVLGVALGLSVLGLIIQSAEVETIMIPVEFDVKYFIISFAITLGFTLITNMMMKKKIRKIDMIESLKSVE